MAEEAGAIIIVDDFVDDLLALDTRVASLEGTRPTVKLALGSPQTLTAVTGTTVAFDTVAWDNESIVSGNTIVPDRDGQWVGTCQVIYEAGATGTVITAVEANGTPIAEDSRPCAAVGYTTRVIIPVDQFLSAGDVVRARGYQDTGGPLDILGAFLTLRYDGGVT